MSAEWEIQKSVFTKLDGDLTVPVYDFVPDKDTDGNPIENKYVTIGADTLIPFSMDGKRGFEGTLQVHSWDVASGRKELKILQGLIYESLDRSSLAVTGYNTVGIDWEFSESSLDPDGVTYHGVQRFRITITEE